MTGATPDASRTAPRTDRLKKGRYRTGVRNNVRPTDALRFEPYDSALRSYPFAIVVDVSETEARRTFTVVYAQTARHEASNRKSYDRSYTRNAFGGKNCNATMKTDEFPISIVSTAESLIKRFRCTLRPITNYTALNYEFRTFEFNGALRFYRIIVASVVVTVYVTRYARPKRTTARLRVGFGETNNLIQKLSNRSSCAVRSSD